MKKALLLVGLLAFLGTSYAANATVTNVTGITCDHCKNGGHVCDKNCKKNCKLAKEQKKCCAAKEATATPAPGSKKSCCAKGGSTAQKSCGGKQSVKATGTEEGKEEQK